jgi:hypothetical protein
VHAQICEEQTYFGSLRAKTHLSTSWHAKTSLTLHKPLENVLHLNLHTTFKHAPENLPSMEVVVCKTTNS